MQIDQKLTRNKKGLTAAFPIIAEFISRRKPKELFIAGLTNEQIEKACDEIIDLGKKIA